jgi:hypothetical protein
VTHCEQVIAFGLFLKLSTPSGIPIFYFFEKKIKMSRNANQGLEKQFGGL